MGDPDWLLPVSMLAALEFVEWLHINHGSPNNFVDVYERNQEEAWETAEHLGWVRTDRPDPRAPRRLGDRREARPVLTASGRSEYERVVALRQDDRRRAAACRQGLLLWLYGPGRGVAGTDKVAESWGYRFHGEPFSQDEIDAAAEFLEERQLITSVGKAWGPILIRPKLTADGLECVEDFDGDVRRYQSRDGAGTVTYTQNFNAPVSGQVAQGGVVSQTQSQGINAAEVAELLRAVVAEAAELSDVDDRSDVEHAIEELRRAALEGDGAEVEVRGGRLKRLTGRLGVVALDAAASGAVTAILAAHGVG